MLFTTKPKYEIGQLISIKSAQLLLQVRITKRRFSGNYDNGEVTFSYDFIHTLEAIQNPWSWSNVSEEDLDDMIHEARLEIGKQIFK